MLNHITLVYVILSWIATSAKAQELIDLHMDHSIPIDRVDTYYPTFTSSNFLSLQASDRYRVRWEGGKIQAAIIAASDCDGSTPFDADVRRVHEAVIEHASRQNIRVIMLTKDSEHVMRQCREMYSRHVEFVPFHDQSVNSVWIRDYGQIIGVNPDGELLIYDPIYFSDRPKDDDTPAVLKKYLQIDYKRLDLAFEGGNFLTNGKVCIVGSVIKDRNNISVRDIEGYFNANMGCEITLVVKSFIDYATGHIDMSMTFANESTLIVGLFEERTDPTNRQIQLGNIKLLESYQNYFDVVVVDQPTNCPARDGGFAPMSCPDVPLNQRVWRTYSNLFHVGDIILIPQYYDVDPQDDPFEQYASVLFPSSGKEILRIDVTTLVKRKGAIHCITSSVPG